MRTHREVPLPIMEMDRPWHVTGPSAWGGGEDIRYDEDVHLKLKKNDIHVNWTSFFCKLLLNGASHDDTKIGCIRLVWTGAKNIFSFLLCAGPFRSFRVNFSYSRPSLSDWMLRLLEVKYSNEPSCPSSDGWSVGHNFLKRQGSYTSKALIWALVTIMLLACTNYYQLHYLK